MSDLWSSSSTPVNVSTPVSPTPVSATPASPTLVSPTPASPTPVSPTPVSQQSGADLVYTGLATYGLFRAFIGAVIATIVGIIIIILGIMELTSKRTISENATITGINGSATGVCTSILVNNGRNNNTSVTYNCSLGVTFTHKGQTYNTLITYSGYKNYTVGQVIPVYFTDDPNSVELAGNNPSMGWIVLVIGIGIVGISWAMYWAARKWKAVAALQGGESIASNLYGNRGGYGGGYGGGNGGGLINDMNIGGLLGGINQ